MKSTLLFFCSLCQFLIVFNQEISRISTNLNEMDIDLNVGIEQNLGSISEFDRIINLDVMTLISYDALYLMIPLGKKYKYWPNVTFELVSMMLAPSNIKFSVRYRGLQYFKDSLAGKQKLSIDFYENYFAFENDHHDIFIVFEDLSGLDVSLHYVPGSICEPNSVLIVDVGNDQTNSPEQIARTIIYGIGRLMGFKNVEEYRQNCSCGYNNKDSCIMTPPTFTDIPTFPKVFDSCNIETFKYHLQSLRCLRREMTTPRLYGKCGDGFIDSKEECDCGHKKLCEDFTDKDKCCNSKCTFTKALSECTYGDCCKKCVFSKSVCRSSIGDCDHSENCDGKSRQCPMYDFVLPNYDICRNNEGFCYNGNCMSLDYMCKYAYNDSRVFFSSACVSVVDEILNTDSQFEDSESIRAFFHNKSQNMCSYFVCALKSKLDIDNAYYFTKSGTHCIVQTETDKYVLSKAPQYMPCLKSGSKGKNYCNEGQCMDSKSIENCVSGNCKNFNKRVTMDIIYKNNIEYISESDKKHIDDNKKEEFVN